MRALMVELQRRLDNQYARQPDARLNSRIARRKYRGRGPRTGDRRRGTGDGGPATEAAMLLTTRRDSDGWSCAVRDFAPFAVRAASSRPMPVQSIA